MTTSQKVLSALNVLQAHPDLSEYIKNFYGIHGFMYTIETEPELLRLNKKLDQLLDDGWHSGASWGAMMRGIQGVLKGIITREQIVKQIEVEKHDYADWCEKKRLEDADI